MSELGDFLRAVSEAKLDYEQNDPKGKKEKEIIETIKLETKIGLGDLFKELAALKQQVEVLESPDIMQEENVIAEVMEPVILEDMGAGQNDIQQYIKSDAFKKHKPVWQEPQKNTTELKSVKDQIKFLEQWISRIASTGPGSGASNILDLDKPVKLVDSSSYTIGRKDYYIGVNYNGDSSIYLPSENIHDGRIVIIKDESGNCSNNQISIIGNVDNDADGAIMEVDNMTLQIIYRNGWRII